MSTEKTNHHQELLQELERLRARVAELEAGEERFRATLYGIGDGMIATDAAGCVLRMNPVAEQLTGWPEDEAVGRPVEKVFNIINEESGAVVESPVSRVLREGIVVGLANHTLLVARDGTERPIADSGAPIRDCLGALTGVVLVFRDQTEERMARRLVETRLSLIEYAASHSLNELLVRSLDVVGEFVDSPIGFYHFVEPDQKTISLQQWSTRTTREYCKAEGEGKHYSMDCAGVWVDCVQAKEPVIHNDYNALSHKKGLPEGHVAVVRELATPVIRDGRVTAILGVGNKPCDYTEKDVEIVSYLADVTWEIVRQKRYEEALRRERDRVRTYLDIAGVMIVALDTDGNVTLINRKGLEILGYSREEVLGKSWFDNFLPEDLKDRTKAVFERLVAGEIELLESHENAIRTKNEERIIAWHNSVVRDAKGDLSGTLSSGTDITERKRAEAALEKRMLALTMPLDDAVHVHFEDLFNPEDIQKLQDEFATATGVASIITHPDGTPITRPSNFCRLCSDIIRKTEKGRINCYRSDAMIGTASGDGPTIQPCMSGGLWDAGASIRVGGKHVANWLIGQVRDDTQDEERIRAYAREIGADENAAAEAFHEVPAMSGEQFGHVARALFTLANQLSTVAYQNVQQARFIMERKRAEEERKRLEKDYRTLFREMTDGFALHEIILDDAGRPVNYRFLAVNPAFELLTGLKAEDIIGKTVLEVLPDIEKSWIDTYGNVALTGAPVSFENYSADLGLYFEVKAFRPAPGQFACIFSDVTGRKRAAEELSRLNAALSAKNDELEQVIYVASHDLRSPLVNIDGYGRELEQAVGDLRRAMEGVPGLENSTDLSMLMEEEIPEALRFIRTSANKMDVLLTGLLRLSRSGRATLKIERLDMNLLLARVIDSMEFQIRKAGVLLEVETLPPCRSDAVQVSQVFQNLLNNAIKYLDPDRPGIIRVSGQAGEKRSCYRVQDNGIGIASAHLNKIFEIFQRIEPDHGPGEGLGLTIVKRILGRLDGEIGVASEPGSGSCFSVELPPDNE